MATLMTVNEGVTTEGTLSYLNGIFAAPPPPFSFINATLTTAANLDVGQVLSLNTATNKYDVVNTKTDFLSKQGGSTVSPQISILLENSIADAVNAVVTAATKGNFVQSKLTPNDIPIGAYNGGALIIEGEVD